jgi:hypothetical protein
VAGVRIFGACREASVAGGGREAVGILWGSWIMSCVGLFAYIGTKNGRPARMAEKDIHNF